jgi:antitoxin component of MazEF toxin-antitoxin module
VNRVVDNKEYAKYVIIIPPEEVGRLQWEEGEELTHEVKEQTLIIRKAKPLSEEALKIASKHVKIKRK